MSVAATSNPGTEETNGATIADTSYRNYDGPLLNRSVRWWTIAVATMRQNVNKTRYGYWIPAALIVLTYFISGAIFYVTQTIRNLGATLPGDTGNPYAVTLYQCLQSSGLLLFAATLTVGAASISADNRANALLVYLARPITRTDYLLGKWMGVFLLLAALSVIPTVVMYLFFLIAYFNDGFWPQNAGLFLPALSASIVPPALHASLIIGFSAWSKTPRLAGAAYAGFYFILFLASAIVGRVLLERDTNHRMPQTIAVVSVASVDGVAQSIAQNAYDVTPQQVLANLRQGRRRNRRRQTVPPPPPRLPERAPLPPMLALAGVLIVVPVVAASLRIRAVEVVRG